MDNYEPVIFISVESGDDLIVSFFVVSPDDPTDGRSLILMRSPKWDNKKMNYDKHFKLEVA